MELSNTASQIISLFLIMIVGFVMKKKHIIDDEAIVRYTRLILNVTLPAQIIKAFVSNQGIMSNLDVLKVFGYTVAMFLIYAVIGVLFIIITRVPKEDRGVYLLLNMFGNVSYMGFPVIEAIYGSESLIYAVIFVVIFNLLIYSLGIYLVSNKEKKAKFDLTKLINTPFIVSLISIVLYFAKIQLPETVMSSLTFLGNVTTPVAMMIIGATIANMPVKKLFNEWRIYVFTAVKLVAIPLVILLILNQLTFISATLKGCLIILSAMPVATTTTMLAIEYDGNVGLTSKGIFFTTLLCAVTIPFVETLV